MASAYSEIVRETGNWFVSFSYENDKVEDVTEVETFSDPQAQIDWLRGQGREWIEQNIQGHDRGIAVSIQSTTQAFDFTPEQKQSRKRIGKNTRRLQRQLARQAKGSKPRSWTKTRLARQRGKRCLGGTF